MLFRFERSHNSISNRSLLTHLRLIRRKYYSSDFLKALPSSAFCAIKKKTEKFFSDDKLIVTKLSKLKLLLIAIISISKESSNVLNDRNARKRK